MEYAISKTDITPAMPVYLEGYGGRNGLSHGVHDNIYATSILLRNNGCTILIVSVDMLSIMRETADELKRRITEKYGLPEQNILIHAIHVHSAPGLTRKLIRGLVEEYVPFFNEQVMKSVDMCFSGLKKGTLHYGEGETYIGVCRRRKVNGEFINAPSPDVPIDRKLGVLAVKDVNDRIDAIIFNCACHPTVMGSDNYLVSSEFPGAARRVIEEKYPGAAALFLQGACGDINPAIKSTGTEYRQGNFSDVEFTGKILANDVGHIVRYGLKNLEPSFECHIRPVELPIGEYKTDFFREMAESSEEYPRKYGSYMLDLIEKGEEMRKVDYNLGFIRLASNFAIVTFEGEVCNEYAAWTREFAPDMHVMIAGYANGHKSYLPTKKILREGGYEATVTYCWAKFPGPYAEAAQDIVLAAVKEGIK